MSTLGAVGGGLATNLVTVKIEIKKSATYDEMLQTADKAYKEQISILGAGYLATVTYNQPKIGKTITLQNSVPFEPGNHTFQYELPLDAEMIHFHLAHNTMAGQSYTQSAQPLLAGQGCKAGTSIDLNLTLSADTHHNIRKPPGADENTPKNRYTLVVPTFTLDS